MFGESGISPQSESTPFHPRSAYGISKVAGFDLTRNYREAYDLHASSGICSTMRVPGRGFEFVTRKITSHVARIKLGKIKELRARESRRSSRLGPCAELCTRDVAHASARHPR